MNANIGYESEVLSDASLVEACLGGNRDAYGQIVARYQSTVCALAYSACGDVARSEDIAQEVFIAAWRQLASLREPAKFKSWLYGIARHLIHNTFRKSLHNPLTGAEPIEDDNEPSSVAAKPDEETISKEEETIIRHALFGLPTVFREPMVLYYRNNESTREVAETLCISEDAVRQRLVRGRTLLNERVASIVQHGLKRSGPLETFAAGVIAALPALVGAPAAKGAVVGMMATQTVKGPAAAAMMALKALAIFAAFLTLPAALGAFFGCLLGRDVANERRRAAVSRFLRIFGLGFGVFILLPVLVSLGVTGHLERNSRAGFLSVMTFWTGLGYAFTLCAVLYWDIKRRFLPQPAPADVATTNTKSGKLRGTALCLTAGAAGLLLFGIFDTNFKVENPSSAELLQLIRQTPPADLTININQGHNHTMFGETSRIYQRFWITVEHGGKTTKYSADVTPEALALLKEKGIPCPTYFAGRDYEILSTPGRLLPLLSMFILSTGGVFLWQRHRHPA